MPDSVKFCNPKKFLDPIVIKNICAHLVDCGVEVIRITGGEPTLRPEFFEIVTLLSELSVQKLGLTSNGQHLENKLNFLKTTKISSINISLDSLDSNTFKKVTRYGDVSTVLRSLLLARDKGFNVKINVVLLRGINDNEVLDFVNFSQKNGIEVRFLELMAIGPYATRHEQLFVPVNETILYLKKHMDLFSQTVESDSTSINFKTSTGAHIGFIASETKPFCGACSRLRLSATGDLRACLMSDKGINIANCKPTEYLDLVHQVFSMKPLDRLKNCEQPMYQIGG